MGTISLMWLASCHNDPAPNPCLGKEPVTAWFTIGEQLFALDTVIVSDTVLSGNKVVFTATETYDYYEWQIGNDTRTFTTKQVSLLFQNPEGTVSVRLIAKRYPNKQCFPTDDGIDTLTRYFTVIDRNLNPILGGYLGSNVSNPSDTFRVQIFYYQPDVFGYEYLNLSNINKDCYPINSSIGTRGFDVAPAYKKFHFGGIGDTPTCKNPTGWVTIDSTGRDIKIDYSYDNGYVSSDASVIIPPTKTFKDVFTGKKSH